MKKLARTLFILLMIMFLLIRMLKEQGEPAYAPAEDQLICDEYFEDDSVGYASPVRRHHRTWNKYAYDSVFCASYEIPHEAVRLARQERQAIRPRGDGYAAYWRDVYLSLHKTSSGKLQSVRDSLLRIAFGAQLSRSDLARMTVAFVQDIPYSYVMPGACEAVDFPCRADERFGILGPLEFLFSLAGDCDTRSVLLYTLLKNMGFSPLIVISSQYQHAMIAVDVPATGDYLEYRGRRFYFWETTNVGWQPGMLPPDTNNVAYWEISLDYEYSPFTPRPD